MTIRDGSGTAALDEADHSQFEASLARSAELERFVAEHYARLVRLAALVCNDHANAEDAVQAGLERAWRKRHQLADSERLSAWLDRIVVREAIRTSARSRSLLARLFRPAVSEIDVAQRDMTPVRDEWIDVRRVYGTLPVEQRAVLALHVDAGYSIAETAVLVRAPIETVRSRLRLARSRLRQALEAVER